ncbi:MAG: NUDIX domain-containing protein [Candidatus Paceibacterota bacterium]
MEYIDVLDENGNPTGEQKTKSQIHIDGDWHRASHVWVVNDNQVLLQRRAKDIDSSPDMYDISAAGHVSAGETALKTALRETQEELGIDLSEDDLIHIGTVKQQAVKNDGTYINNEHNDIYIIKKDISIDDISVQKEEVQYVKWIDIKELKKWVKERKEDLVDHTAEYKVLFEYLGN